MNKENSNTIHTDLSQFERWNSLNTILFLSALIAACSLLVQSVLKETETESYLNLMPLYLLNKQTENEQPDKASSKSIPPVL